MDGRGTKCRRKIAEIYNRLSRVHEHYRQTVWQTDDRQTDGRWQLVNVNVSSRSLKMIINFDILKSFEQLRLKNAWLFLDRLQACNK